MRATIRLSTVALALTATTAAIACTPNQPGKLQMGRTITIDTTKGLAHGSVSYGETGLLRDKEVLLTFDDGPVAGRTTAVLDALEHHCVKATFFPVGRMAMARPEILRDTLRRGHTIGGHTWSHPNLRRVNLTRARRDIQKGFAALEAILGLSIAPVFRFPYLAESKRTLAYVKSKNIASLSIDVDSRDTRRGAGVRTVVRSSINGLRKRGRGILLFHDSKRATATALPQILDQLAKDGFRVVHLETKSAYRAEPALVTHYKRQLEGAPNAGTQPITSSNRPRSQTAARAAHPQIRQRSARQQQQGRRQAPRPAHRAAGPSQDWRRSVFGIQ